MALQTEDACVVGLSMLLCAALILIAAAFGCASPKRFSAKSCAARCVWAVEQMCGEIPACMQENAEAVHRRYGYQ